MRGWPRPWAATDRERRSSGSHQCPKKNWCRSWRSSITAVSPASHSLATDQWPLAARHSPLPACFGFVFDPQARAGTIQPQAAMNFALIPDWLRLAPFLVPGASLASARCARVRLPRSHPRPLAACRSLRIHWPRTSGHGPLFRVRLPHSHPTCRRSLSPATQAATDHRHSPGPPVTFRRWVPEASAGRSPRHHTLSTSPRIRHPPSGVCHPPSALCHPPSALCHPPSALCHPPSALCHPPSALCHPPSGICYPPFLLPHSPFQNPQSAISETLPAFASARGAGRTSSGGAARMPGCNPAPRGRTARRPRRPRFAHARPASPRAGRRAAR